MTRQPSENRNDPSLARSCAGERARGAAEPGGDLGRRKGGASQPGRSARASLLGLVGLLTFGQQDAGESVAPRRIEEHAQAIVQLVASRDGSVLVSAAGGEIRAWDVRKGRVLWRTRVSEVPLAALDVGGRLIAGHHGQAGALILDLETGEQRLGIAGTTAMQTSRCLVVDPRDRWIWVGTTAGLVTRLVPGNANAWSNRSMKNDGVTCVAMDAGGDTLAVGGRDATVRFVDAKNAVRDEQRVIQGHPAAVSAVALDPEGKLVVSGSEVGDLRVWKASSCKPLHLLREKGAAVRRLAVDGAGKRLASGDDDGRVELWDLRKGVLLARLETPGDGPVSGLAFVGRGDSLAAARGRTLALHDLARR